MSRQLRDLPSTQKQQRVMKLQLARDAFIGKEVHENRFNYDVQNDWGKIRASPRVHVISKMSTGRLDIAPHWKPEAPKFIPPS
jgi:hypothetical protein